MKRFYREAAAAEIEGGWTVALDGRPVRTPARAPLVLPTAALAEAIAVEWNAQGEEVRPAEMVLTGLANAAIDRIAPDPGAFAAGLARYGETDLLCYRADGPPPLVARQARLWDPILDWATHRYDVAFTRITGLIHAPQPAATLARIVEAYAALDPFRLAALSSIVTVTGSAIIGLAVVEGALDGEAAWAAGQLDETWQTEQWGDDPLAAAAREERRRALGGAMRMLALL